MLGVVILNFNGWDLTIDCVKSLSSIYADLCNIYIVDNASTKKITEEFKIFLSDYSQCTLIMNPINNGYSAGNNVGIKKALEDGCTHILVTNNDVIFKENSIDELQDFLDNNSNYGIAGPKVLLPDGRIQEINMGCKMTMLGKYKYLIRKTPLSFLSKKFVDEFHSKDKDMSCPFDVYAVSGCCFMMSRECAEKLYPFDENTFLYEEENIIGVRMDSVGLKTIYDTNSEIIHIGGASTQEMSEFAYGCFVCSEQYYCREYLHASYIKRLPLYILRGIKYVKTYGLINYIKFTKKVKI